jgi:energy-coupling factor transport system substrate-specific component
MKAVFTMWKETRMIILVAVTAAIYAAALIAFKTAIPLIPGITEVRVANIFPMVFGLLFGPAGAWGTAIGNLIGDLLGGTFGPGSAFGFIGNFFLGYLPYTLWVGLKPFALGERDIPLAHWRTWLMYVIIALVSSVACAVVIAFGLELLGLVPYPVLSTIISVNNTVASIIGILLLIAVYGVVRRQLRLTWWSVMDEEDIGRPFAAPVGAWLVTIGALVAWIAGAYLFPEQALLIGGVGSLTIIIGSILL